MNIALFCVLIIITGETDGFHVENIRTPKEDTRERISLRKLHSFERDVPKEAKTVTWNQILADALVNRIKIFSFNKATENEHSTDTGMSSNLLTNCISQMMHLYKTLVYDKIHEHPTKTVARPNTELSKENTEANDNTDKNGNVEAEKRGTNPNEEVEIIEPKYHGKMCDNCEGKEQKDADGNGTGDTVETTGIVPTSVSGCPSGLVASEGGGCAEPKSKFILSIPYQCPIGYRRDWLGYCRPQL